MLIVDDDEADRLFHATVLGGRGYETVVARDGAEALRLYLERRIDVVVTDLHMPVPDGMDLIAAITSADPTARIVLVSGGLDGELNLAKVVGARAALSKPVDPQALIDAVEEHRKAGA